MQYGLGYYEHTLRKCSASGQEIAERRWRFLGAINPKAVLDYGCGISWFRAFRPKDILVDTYDINLICPQTGLTEMRYDLVCFWDSLEHIPDLNVLNWIYATAKYIALAIPIKPPEVKMKDWKHFRPPDEHCHYFDHESIDLYFTERGFRLLAKDTCECPPREDIWNLLYENLSN